MMFPHRYYQPRGPARLSDRAFIQLLVDLGDLDLPIDLEPGTPLTDWEISYVLHKYHNHPGLAAPSRGWPPVSLCPWPLARG